MHIIILQVNTPTSLLGQRTLGLVHDRRQRVDIGARAQQLPRRGAGRVALARAARRRGIAADRTVGK